jgi:hypothetical protein
MIAKMKARGLHCSFCGKSNSEVAVLVAGAPPAIPGVPRQKVNKSAFICSECVRRYHQRMSAAGYSSAPALAPK